MSPIVYRTQRWRIIHCVITEPFISKLGGATNARGFDDDTAPRWPARDGDAIDNCADHKLPSYRGSKINTLASL
jgi:hypothetical protein